jgi:hypothetical protein
MFNDSMRGVSTLSYALLNSARDMIVRNNIEELIDAEVQFVNNSGDVYIPLSKGYTARPDGTDFPLFIPGGIQENPDFKRPDSFQNFRSYFIDSEITTLSYDKSISLASLLKQLADEPSIYGVVLQKTEGDYSVNPLHPIIAFLVSAGLMQLPDEGKLHIFEWKKSKIKEMEELTNQSHIDSYIKDFEKFFSISPYIINDPITVKQWANINDNEVTSIIEDPFIENLQATIRVHRGNTGNTDLDKISSLVIPHHLISDGVLFPYYGISLIGSPTNSNIKGVGLGPMVTGNISLAHDDGDRSFTSFYGSANTSNVCTGSENSIVPKGWFTLSRVNLNSMYYNDVISYKYVHSFITASKKVASDIWQVAIDEQKAELEEA